MKENKKYRTTKRTDEEKQKIQRRLNIIEGQVRGIKQMIIDDRYCGDILIQLSAINKAADSLGNYILKNYLETSIVNDIKNDKIEVIDEVMGLFERLD